MTASLASFLPDFELSGIRSFHAPTQNSAPAGDSGESRIDLEAIRNEARAEGEAAARAELARSHAAEREAEATRHALELEVLRAELEAMAAETIPQAIAARSADIAELIAGDVADILAPLLDQAVRSHMLAGLAGEIRAALDLDNAGQISVSGPEGMIESLREALGADADRVVMRQTDGIDFDVEVDRTRFASRIREWSKTLAESLA
ncbi:hypothetical protein OEG84_20060 [Hoeflea sp. G2-23]|uniref:Flagellar assembly protein FliH/Type III secretion system HrpE domain-containing protein n=1 Tax=Hoeflea algicola TaxID=2983763 RepID=A0ABT3ZDQ4_9HYPH|nr:hypothetical protein [Hoeflea algicola]MCY0149930.1 hypothetical protein [Hoeflea algicola]